MTHARWHVGIAITNSGNGLLATLNQVITWTNEKQVERLYGY